MGLWLTPMTSVAKRSMNSLEINWLKIDRKNILVNFKKLRVNPLRFVTINAPIKRRDP